MLLVGDIHGNFEYIQSLCKLTRQEPIIQLGDMGLGFGSSEQPDIFPDNFYFIRGNHDNPMSAKAYSNYLGDFGYNEKLKLFFISGADSTDKAYRKENVSWWRNEQLSDNQLFEAFKLYTQVRPEIVISHTCPAFVTKLMIQSKDAHRTEKMLEKMWNLHQPKLWLFGHFHPESLWDFPIKNTRFICVPIDQYFYLRQ
jgi:hypothetical protein